MAIAIKARGQYMTKNEHGRTGVSPRVEDAFRYETAEAAQAEVSLYLGCRKGGVEFVVVPETDKEHKDSDPRRFWTDSEMAMGKPLAEWTEEERFQAEPNMPWEADL
jgi:aromatic ring-cleaving dioxygenase